MNANFKFDIVIIGGGSAAFSAAIKATERGAEVAVCEEGVIGGTCLNRGCIPSKSLLKASEVFYYSHIQPFRGIEIPKGMVNFTEIIEQKDELVHSLRQEKYLNTLTANKKIHYFKGKAAFISRDEVKVNDQVLIGDKFIIATGGALLLISQFTLLGDCRKGRRPSFDRAASAGPAKETCERLVESLKSTGIRVETGEFQAHMEVESVNDGPITLLLDSRKVF